MNALVVATLEKYGAVDIFCSNAGIIGRHGLDASLKEWRRTMDVNFMAHVLAARAVVPIMLKQGGGYIVATASAAGLLMQVDSATYTVSKHAAVAFAEWLSVNYAERGIRVSCLCPQGVRTPMLLGPSGDRKSFLSEGSVSAEEVAAKVVGGDRGGALPDPAAPGSRRVRAPQGRGPRPLARRHAPPARGDPGRPEPGRRLVSGGRLEPASTWNSALTSPAFSNCSFTGTLSPSLNGRLMSTNIRCAPPGFNSKAALRRHVVARHLAHLHDAVVVDMHVQLDLCRRRRGAPRPAGRGGALVADHHVAARDLAPGAVARAQGFSICTCA